MNRRHDIDALRALAFGLVILYHVAMAYVAGWDWHLKSPHAAEWLQAPMRAVNLWRMDLVFLVSGLAVALLRRGRTLPRLFALRSWRLLLPLAFGMAVVVPYQPYAQGVANGLVPPGFGDFLRRYATGGPWPAGAFDGWQAGVTWNHLWYLAYLWVYTAALAALMPLLESPAGRRVRESFAGLRGVGLAWPVLPLLAWSALLWPRFPATHDLVHDGWLHAVYFTLFLYGYWIGTDRGWWSEVMRLRRTTLATAVACLAGYLVARAIVSSADPLPARLAVRWLADAYLWAMLLAVLGWAHRLLNRPWPWLAWANESVYPWYVLHQTLIIVLLVQLGPLRLGPWLEPALLIAGTVAGCWVLTEVIRRVPLLRPLFGLKARIMPPARLRCPSPATPARPAERSA